MQSECFSAKYHTDLENPNTIWLFGSETWDPIYVINAKKLRQTLSDNTESRLILRCHRIYQSLCQKQTWCSTVEEDTHVRDVTNSQESRQCNCKCLVLVTNVWKARSRVYRSRLCKEARIISYYWYLKFAAFSRSTTAANVQSTCTPNSTVSRNLTCVWQYVEYYVHETKKSCENWLDVIKC